MGLVAPRHVGSSRTRAWTCVPCIGRWILNHCSTREVPLYLFDILIIMYLVVVLFRFIFFGTLCDSWAWMFVSCVRLRNFSAIILQISPCLFFLSSPSGTPIIQMLVCLMLSQRFLKWPSFFKFFFIVFYSIWVISTTLSSSLLICSSVSCILLFISSGGVFFLLFVCLFVFATSWILVPQQGIKPVPPAVEAQSPNHRTAREFPLVYF